MDSTPCKPPPFPTGTSARLRRQRYSIEDVQLHEDMAAVLNVALTDPTRAGIMMHDLATRQLVLPVPAEAAATTPLRNQQRRSTRFLPYSTERRTRTFHRPDPPASMFDRRNLYQLSPATSSHSSDQYLPRPERSLSSAFSPPSTPQQPAQPSLPTVLSRVRELPDFEHLHAKPCLRLVRSDTSVVELSRPSHCIFDERRREWIVADRDLGIVFLNKECFHILRSIKGFDEACAVALLKNGEYLGVLDRRGIFIHDFRTGENRSVFPCVDCRGLAVTAVGDFVTVNPRRRCIFLIPQNGDRPLCFPYEPLASKNYEGLTSTASYVNVSTHRLLVVDYAIGSFNLYKFDPYTRKLNFMVQQDCTNGVALCRLTGGFMDQKGRIIVSNCKERICMLFDHDGKFLQRITCDGGFPRTQHMCVNKDFQAVLLDTLQKPHSARLYRIIADPAVLGDDFPASKHPIPFYAQTPSGPTSSSSSHMNGPHQYDPPSPHYLEPGEVEDTLVSCKDRIADIRLGNEIEPITIDADESVEEIVLDGDEEITLD